MAFTLRPLPILLLHALFLLSPSSAAALTAPLCSKKDTATLMKIKKFFQDSPSVASWKQSENCCTWQNVGCNGDSTIIYLNIYGSNYPGPVPGPIGHLPALIDIYFEDNPYLSGPIPSFFANLTALKSIVIKNSSLSGPIPTFLCALPVLYDLDFSSNRLTGPIPGCLESKFASINFAGNQLTGTIPPSLFHGSTIFTGLILLDLSDNRLTGQVPKSFKDITFDTLHLSGNRLAGDASFLFGRSRTTKYMDLSRNELDFDLSPVKFPRNLRYLNISRNRITGRIPKQITKLIALEDLDVSYNELCGPIPGGGSMRGSNYPSSAFEHNKCLCGAPLPPCNGTAGK